MRNVRLSCELVKVIPSGDGKCAVFVGSHCYGFVEGPAEELYGKACKMVAKAEWKAIEGAVMGAAARAASEDRLEILGMIEKGVVGAEHFEHLMLKEAA